jgi:hypothetical protein
MEWRQEQGTVSAALALETGREWTLWLTEVERWLMQHFTHREARHRAWAVVYLRVAVHIPAQFIRLCSA